MLICSTFTATVSGLLLFHILKHEPPPEYTDDGSVIKNLNYRNSETRTELLQNGLSLAYGIFNGKAEELEQLICRS